jgi:LAS superfamily LD-carboxypeptidase LdcB
MHSLERSAAMSSHGFRQIIFTLVLTLSLAGASSFAAAHDTAPTARGEGKTATPSRSPANPPEYQPQVLPPALEQEFVRKNYKRDSKSGNYLSPKVFTKTLNEGLFPVPIGGRYVKDLKGQPVFLRESVRSKLLEADQAMFEKKHQHIIVNYGFRTNVVQQELFRKIAGTGKVAPAGGSFHETGMALDISNWRDAQKFMIEAGFVGGCYGIEEDFVHYSIGEVTKASNFAVFKRCTIKELPKQIVKGIGKVGGATVHVFKRGKHN